MILDKQSNRLDVATWTPSPNYDEREEGSEPEVIIVHCISLPPGEYGGGQIERFFQNKLSPDEHPYFQSMAHLQVSSHFLIDRLGQTTQFVATDKRAWHAGESVCLGRPKVNDFSIGIELEGWDLDTVGFTQAQYVTLCRLTRCLIETYPRITQNSVFAHSDIAPGRKPDPGSYFSWSKLYSLLDNTSI